MVLHYYETSLICSGARQPPNFLASWRQILKLVLDDKLHIHNSNVAVFMVLNKVIDGCLLATVDCTTP